MKFGLFFDDSIIGSSYILSIFIILMMIRNIILKPSIKVGTIVLILVSFFCYLLANRDISIYYYQILLVLSFFNLHNNSINKYDILGISCIIIFELIYSIVLYFINLSQGVDNIIVKGTFDNPIGFVCFIICSIPVVLSYYFISKKKVISILFIIFIIICFSQSRIGLFAYLFLIFFHFYYHSEYFRCYVNKYKYLLIISSIFICIIFFIIKYDSSNGRLLIWYVVSDIVKSNPISGIGMGEFRKVYMFHQASVLSFKNSEYWNYLADNICHPFSEYLLIYTELGLVGIIIIFYILIRTLKFKNQYSEIILVISICSLVSYPLSYPCIWVILGFALSHIILLKFTFPIKSLWVIKLLTTILLLVWLIFLVYDIDCNYKWKRCISQISANDKFIIYNKLYENKMMQKNPYFLYDFGIFLSNENKSDSGIIMLNKAACILKDYNLELSLGNMYDKKGDYLLAEQHYLLASKMCPNRFTPLFFLFKLYDKNKIFGKAIKLAYIIDEKKVKVNSVFIKYMKFEAQNYIKINSTNSNL